MTRPTILRTLIASGGLVALVAARSFLAPPVDSAAQAVSTVRRADFDLRVDALGVVDAVRSESFVSAMPGDKGKIVQIADDGARVEKGDLLVRFDATLLEAELRRLEGELRSREAILAYARQALEIEKSQIEKSLVHSQVEAQGAREEFARHQSYIEALEALGKRGIPVDSEIAQAKRKAEHAQLLLDEAESEFERLKKESVHRLEQAMAEVNKADSEMNNTVASRELTRDELAKTELRAAVRGFVVLDQISVGEQKRRLRVGDTVWQGQPILYIPDLSEMLVRAKVREEDLHELREGQAATIQIEAYPEVAFKGRVTGVGALALEGDSANVAGKYFRMTVAMDEHDDRLRPGMTARVDIVAARARRVLVVPTTAVFYAGDQTICYLASGASLTSRPVRVGRRGDDVVEILSGLSGGEQVSLVAP